MLTISTQNELIIRLSFFFGVLICMGILERLVPKRIPIISKPKRWLSNLSIIVLNSVIIRLLFPGAAIGVAYFAQQYKLGVFNIIHIDYWPKVILSVIILDFIIYLQHVIFHAIPTLWRIHRMHHIDLDFDVTTGARFHPFEIIISLLIKFGAIILFGTPALSVLIFEVLLNAITMFNHGNIRMPTLLDKIIRSLIVTPDMHRVHHSDLPFETNSNFGFNLSLWDRLFGTYRKAPQLGHEQMNIGIKSIRDKKYCVNLLGMLIVPFLKQNNEYPINRKPE